MRPQSIRRSPSIVVGPLKRIAPPPFNSPDADLRFQTQDDTTFMVHKQIIILASLFFHDFFKMEGTSLSTPDISFPLKASSTNLEIVLRLTYPLPPPVLYDLDDVSDAYATAKQYEFVKAQRALEDMLVLPRFLEAEPVRVYAVACRYKLNAVINAAAAAAMRFSETWPDYDEFKTISGHDYHALLRLHRKRRVQSIACLEDPKYVKCTTCPGCTSPSYKLSKWWKLYVQRARVVLERTPSSKVVCGVAFLAEIQNGVGCEECPRGILKAMCPGGGIEQLRKAIDALPTTPTR
ncbi:hypothetical protein B0H21DRAFT_292236 [Amylocystis lapponica]|nr:hypothetical protein B0H21DRAFT_292236 [Amylocystis lapponica]